MGNSESKQQQQQQQQQPAQQQPSPLGGSSPGGGGAMGGGGGAAATPAAAAPMGETADRSQLGTTPLSGAKGSRGTATKLHMGAGGKVEKG
jgi:hypothetical protein